MNFAFASILIVLMIAPGIIMFRGFFSPPFTKKILPSNPINDLINAIIPSFLLHTFYLGVVYFVTNYKVDFQVVGNLLMPTNDATRAEQGFQNLSSNFHLVVCYHLILWGLAYVIGYVSRYIIRGFKLDTTFRFFRFNNKWHYLLSGEITRFPRVNLKSLRFIDYIVVDMLIKSEEGDLIYTGILQEYSLNNQGDLDTLVLTHVVRRPFNNEKRDGRLSEEKKLQDTLEDTDKYYKIPGSLFVIPYSKISNLNLWYMNVRHSVSESTISQENSGSTPPPIDQVG